MSVPVLESYTEQGSSSDSSTLTLSKPSGVSANDLLLIIVGNDDSTDTAQFSDNKSGWTFIHTRGDSGCDVHIGAFYKIATGSEPSTEDVTAQSADEWMGWYLRISGVDTSDPINAERTQRHTSNSTSHIVDEVTTTVDDCLVVGCLMFDGGDGPNFGVSNTGWSEKDEYSNDPGQPDGISSVIFTKSQSSAGATGDVTVTSNAADCDANDQIAIAPGAGGRSTYNSRGGTLGVAHSMPLRMNAYRYDRKIGLFTPGWLKDTIS